MPATVKVSADGDKHLSDITAILFSQDHVFTSGGDGKIKVWTKDLSLKKEVSVHEAWIYAMAVDSTGRIYSSSADGTIRSLADPLQSDKIEELLKCSDDIESLFVDSKDNFYSGDDKGIITMWVDRKIKFKFNLVEQMRSIAVQNNFIYSIRDNDLTITEVLEGSSTGRYITKSSIPGKSPVALCGSYANTINSHVAIVTRDGLGVVCIKNSNKEHFPVVWTKEKAHDMIINSILGAGEDLLYTAGYDGIVKQWNGLEKDPKLVSEVNIGAGCLNALCLGADQSTVYVGGSDGLLRAVQFS
uniref:Putative wd40 domain protein n=1 Tax=Culex tarsalis TaxID=7177 RepID=A0A1Q3F980_CULTA